MLGYLVSLILALYIRDTSQHGYLAKPPQRSSMWRYGFPTPPNYNDNELYCGGIQDLIDAEGRCGPCGDPYFGVRENEAGGKYATGIIAEELPIGATELKAEVKVSSYHKGYFSFRLCAHNDPQTPVSQECLDRTPLRIKEGDAGHDYFRYYPSKPWERREGDTYRLTLELPRGIICSQCVLQWIYITGNSWGTTKDGVSCLGCGPQEEFRNCADISIGAGSNNLETMTAKTVVMNSIAGKASEALTDVDLYIRDSGTANEANFPRQHTLMPPSALKSAFEVEWKLLKMAKEQKSKSEIRNQRKTYPAVNPFNSRRLHKDRAPKKKIEQHNEITSQTTQITTRKAHIENKTKQTTSPPVLSWVGKVMKEIEGNTKVTTPKNISPYPSNKEINLSKGHFVSRKLPDQPSLRRNEAEWNTLYRHIPESSTMSKKTKINRRLYETTTPKWQATSSSLKEHDPFKPILIPSVQVRFQGDRKQTAASRINYSGNIRKASNRVKTKDRNHFLYSGFTNMNEADRKAIFVASGGSGNNGKPHVATVISGQKRPSSDLYNLIHGNLVNKHVKQSTQIESDASHPPTMILPENGSLTAGRLTSSSLPGRLPSESIYIETIGQPSDASKMMKTKPYKERRKSKQKQNKIRKTSKKGVVYSATGNKKSLAQPTFVFEGKFAKLSSASKNQNKLLEHLSNKEELTTVFDDDLPQNRRVQTWENNLPREEQALLSSIDSATPPIIPQTTEHFIKTTFPLPTLEPKLKPKLDAENGVSINPPKTSSDASTSTSTNQKWHSSTFGIEKTSYGLPTEATITNQPWHSSSSAAEKMIDKSNSFISQPNPDNVHLSTPEFMISEYRYSFPMTTPETDIFVTNLSENKVKKSLQPEDRVLDIYMNSKHQRQEGSDVTVRAKRIKKVMPKSQSTQSGTTEKPSKTNNINQSQNRTTAKSKDDDKSAGFTQKEIDKFQKQYDRALKVLAILHKNPRMLLRLPMFAGHNVSDKVIGKLIQRMENAKRHIHHILYENAKNAT